VRRAAAQWIIRRDREISTFGVAHSQVIAERTKDESHRRPQYLHLHLPARLPELADHRAGDPRRDIDRAEILHIDNHAAIDPVRASRFR
jgi:hypothetical protein